MYSTLTVTVQLSRGQPGLSPQAVQLPNQSGTGTRGRRQSHCQKLVSQPIIIRKKVWTDRQSACVEICLDSDPDTEFKMVRGRTIKTMFQQGKQLLARLARLVRLG